MTIAPNSAPPGSYIWDYKKGYTGRINLDGSEDRRFTALGECSFLNGFTKGAHLSNPTATARSLITKGESNEWVIKGYTLILGGGQDLTLDQWLSDASDALGGVCGIQEILAGIANDPVMESEAKLEAIRKLFRLEVSRRRLGHHPQVVAAREKHEAELARAADERDAQKFRDKYTHMPYDWSVFTFVDIEDTKRSFLYRIGGSELVEKWEQGDHIGRKRQCDYKFRRRGLTFIDSPFAPGRKIPVGGTDEYQISHSWILLLMSKIKSYHLDALEYTVLANSKASPAQRDSWITVRWLACVMGTKTQPELTHDLVTQLLGTYRYFKHDLQVTKCRRKRSRSTRGNSPSIDTWSV